MEAMPVMLTRIALVALFGACFLPAAAPADDAGFVSIFNGTSLDGWEGKPEFWRVEDGAIVGQTTAENPTKGNTFLVWRQGLVDDFELALQCRLTGGNSGVQYRSREFTDVAPFVVGGYQGDYEAGPKYSGILYEERGRGILTLRGERNTILADGTKSAGVPIATAEALQQAIKPGDWNELRIVAKGSLLQHFINGVQTVDVTDETAVGAKKGLLALQLHAGPPMVVQFKDITLKEIK